MKTRTTKNREARIRLEEWYQKFLHRIRVPVSQFKVKTDFGSTHVLTTGDKSKPVLVCLHAMRTSSAHLMSELGPLAERFYIIAPDLPGQSVKGLDSRMPYQDDSFSRWLLEVIDKLQLDSVNLFGVSFGAFVARKFASYRPDRVRRLVLLVPAGIVSGPVIRGLVQLAIPMIQFKWHPTTSHLQKLVKPLITTWDVEWARYVADSLSDFTLDFRIPPLATDKELNSLPMPCLIMAAENDLSFPGVPLLRRAESLMRNVEVELLRGCRHCPPTTDAFRSWMSFRITMFLIKAGSGM